MTDELDLAKLRELLETATPGENLCPELRKDGGCTLHNLHCGYPECNRKPGEKEAQDGLRRMAPTLARRVLSLSEENERAKRELSAHIKLEGAGITNGTEFRQMWNEMRTRATTAEQSLAAAEQKLREAADMLDEALSGFIPGIADDNRWNVKRDRLVAEIRANLAKETTND